MIVYYILGRFRQPSIFTNRNIVWNCIIISMQCMVIRIKYKTYLLKHITPKIKKIYNIFRQVQHDIMIIYHDPIKSSSFKYSRLTPNDAIWQWTELCRILLCSLYPVHLISLVFIVHHYYYTYTSIIRAMTQPMKWRRIGYAVLLWWSVG